MDYGNKRRVRRIARTPVALVLALILFIFAARSVWNMYEKSKIVDKRLEQAKTELAKLEERRDDLSQKLDYLSSERGQEAAMRTKYRGVREGEKVAVIVDEAAQALASAAMLEASSGPTSGEGTGIFKKILRALGLGR